MSYPKCPSWHVMTSRGVTETHFHDEATVEGGALVFRDAWGVSEYAIGPTAWLAVERVGRP